jgi:hypothetical protein
MAVMGSKRRISSRPEVTPGAPESSGDQSAGIGTWRTPIRRQRWLGCKKTWWGRIKSYGHCASRREIDIPIDSGVEENLSVSQ